MNPRELVAFFEAPADGNEDGPPVISRMSYDVRLLHAILVVLLAIEEAVMHPPILVGAEGPPDPFERTMPASVPDETFDGAKAAQYEGSD